MWILILESLPWVDHTTVSNVWCGQRKVPAAWKMKSAGLDWISSPPAREKERYEHTLFCLVHWQQDPNEASMIDPSKMTGLKWTSNNKKECLCRLGTDCGWNRALWRESHPNLYWRHNIPINFPGVKNGASFHPPRSQIREGETLQRRGWISFFITIREKGVAGKGMVRPRLS